MAYNDRQTAQKVQGNWTCSKCGATITELPFEPKEGRPIFCADCWAKERDSRPRRDFGPKPRVQGNWKCSKCGAAITDLPFNPAPGKELFCTNCWREMRNDK